MRRYSLHLLFALLLLAPAVAAAQEVGIPFDDAGRLERIDRVQAQRLGLWTDRYPGFEEARLFRSPDGTVVLEITSRRDGRLLRDRVPLDAAALAALRADVADRLAAGAGRPAFTRAGRPLLLTGTTVAGLTYYGWAVPVALGVDDGRLAVATYMLTAGASFFVPWVATRDESVTLGMADFALWGISRGAVHGALLHGALAGDSGGESVLTSSVATSVGLGYATYRWARDANLGPGTTHAIGAVSDLSALAAGGLAAVADADVRAGSAATLAGAAAGVAGGRWLAARRDFTWGDAEVLRTAALLGAFAPQALARAFDASDDAHVLLGVAGGAAGLLVGDRLVRRADFDDGEAVLIDLSTLAGAALGLGAAYLIDPEADSPTLYLGSSALGAALGFGGMYAALLPDARDRAARERGAWQIGVSPTLHLAGAGAAGVRAVPAARLRVQYRF